MKSWFFNITPNRIINFLLLCLYSVKSSASINPLQIAKLLARANAEITTKTSSAIGEGDFLISGDSIYVNPDGTHYLYSYNFKRNTFVRLDHSTFHGHNFIRYLFQYNGDIFAFGGYGFWNNHSKLIKFDHLSREWELVLIKGLPVDQFQPILSHKMGDSLFIFGTIDYHNPIEASKTTSKKFIVNLRNLTAQEMEEDPINFLKSLSIKAYNSQFSDYIVWGNDNSIDFIFDKKLGKYYRNASGPSFFAPNNTRKIQYQDSIFRFVVNQEFISVYPNGSIERTDLREYIKLFGVEENDIHDWKPLVKHQVNWWKILAIIFSILSVILILLGLVFYKKNGKGMNQKIFDYYEFLDNYDSVIHKISMLEKGSYSEPEMDIILRISHLPKSVRKIKRSQIIFSINEQFPGLIEKTEDAKKKEFIYHIHKVD